MPPAAPEPLTDWLEADYFRRPRSLRRLRRVVGWLTFLGASVAVAMTVWPGKPTIYQAGPLSPAHAMFNDQCQVCHTEAFRTTQRLLPGHADMSTVPDEACVRCHAGSLHNTQQVRTPGCGTCHHEHQGHNQLARVSDSHCTTCHADLKRKDGGVVAKAMSNVRDFREHHPEFRIWRGAQPTDPGRLHFNHQVHLRSEGIPSTDGRIVKLDCESCHQPDSERRYMRPVTYAHDCASCHPLSVQLAGQGNGAAALRAAEEFRKQPAPHKTPAEVRAELRDRLLTLAARAPELRESMDADLGDRPLPGKRPAPPEILTAAAWAEQELQVSERILFRGAAGCAYCHIRKPGPTSVAGALPVFEPTQLPRRWLTHGGFSHNSHRMLTCAACHPASDSRQTSDVLIPRVESCQKCHHPQGARSDCSNCHRYHDRSRDGQWQGHFTIGESLGLPARGGP